MQSNTAEYRVLSLPLSLELTFMSVITFPSFKPQTFTLKKIRNQGAWKKKKEKTHIL